MRLCRKRANERDHTMKADIDRLKEIPKPRSAEAVEADARRRQNRKWTRMSQDIALSIRQSLRQRGATQRWLADKIGVSPAYIGKILKGHENLTLETISRLQEALGCSLVTVRTPYVQTMTVERAGLPHFSSTASSDKYNSTQRGSITSSLTCHVA